MDTNKLWPAVRNNGRLCIQGLLVDLQMALERQTGDRTVTHGTRQTATRMTVGPYS